MKAEIGSSGAGVGGAARPAWLEGAALVHLDGRHAEMALHAARCAPRYYLSPSPSPSLSPSPNPNQVRAPLRRAGAPRLALAQP